ncbi:dentin sialophosphoprotein-like [Macrobrachium nipponense]|uniref:dentin sialophosphoprotein-like n=1 Tax=Macrobrachium nipponense TaxID=159736 RepID=UPI0030C7DC66
MPKVFGWAKKLSGHSSKSSKRDSDSESTSSSATQSPEKKPKASDGDGFVRNPTSENSQNVDKKSLPTKRPSFIRRLSPEKRYSTDSSKLSPENGLAPDKKGGLEKRHNSDRRTSPEKRPSGFAQRFASFRISKLDKSSKAKRKSPEPELSESTEVLEQNSETELRQDNAPLTCTGASSPVTAKENVITGAVSDSGNLAAKETSTNPDRISTLDQKNNSSNEPDLNNDLPIIRSHNDQNSNDSSVIERNINPRTSRVPARQSISEKLYGEVIKEFDKIRTTKPRVPKIESEVSTSDDSPRSASVKSAKLDSDNTEQCPNQHADDKIANSRFTVCAVCEIGDEKSDSGDSDKKDLVPAPENAKEQSCISEHPPEATKSTNEDTAEDLKASGAFPSGGSIPLPIDFKDRAPLASDDFSFIDDEEPTEISENELDTETCESNTDVKIESEKNEGDLTPDSFQASSETHETTTEEDHVITEELSASSNCQEMPSPASGEHDLLSSEDLSHDKSVSPVEEVKESESSISCDGQNINHLIAEPYSNGSESLESRPNQSVEQEDNGDIHSPELSVNGECNKIVSEERLSFSEDSKDNHENIPKGTSTAQDDTVNTDADDEELATSSSCKINGNGELTTSSNPQLDEDEKKSENVDSSPSNNSFASEEMKAENGVTFKDEMLALLDKTFLGGNADSLAETEGETKQENNNDGSPSKTVNVLTETEPKIDSPLDGGPYDSKLTLQEVESQSSYENDSESASECKVDSNKVARENLDISVPERKISMPAPRTCAYNSDRQTDDNSSFDESYEESYKEGRGSSLPSSPLAPRRKKKPHPVPAARTFYTLGSKSSLSSISGSATPDCQDQRSGSCNTPPPRPPAPSMSPDKPPIRKRSSTVPCKTSETSDFSSTRAKAVCSSNGESSAAKMVSTDSTIDTSSDSKSLNPFESDDDEETSSTKDEPKVDTQSYKSSKDPLNPFDSEDDEVEETVKPDHEERKRVLPPAGYNPFDEEDEENEENEAPKTTSKDVPTNPFDEEDEVKAMTPRGSLYQHTFVTPDSSPFRREGTRASLPSSGRILYSKKKRQAPLPPGYGSSGTVSACATPLLPSRTALFRGDSYSSLDRSSLRKSSATSYSTLSLTSPKKTPPPRPPPPKARAISLAQLK